MPDISQFDHEFLTAGSQSAEGEKLAGLVQQNLTPEEQKRLEEIMPILEEFNMLILKAQTGEFPEGAEEMGFINEQGVPEQGMMEGRVPQDMQNQQRPPLQAVEGQMPQNAPEMMAEGGYARSGSTYSTVMDQAKAIVREKHPRQAKYLDALNIVMKPDMEGHSEYRSGDYDDSKEYRYKHTIEINPKYSKTPEEIASTIAGETLHHMRDKDPEFREMWSGLRETLGQDPDFRKFQEKRQGTMEDTRDLDHFIDASALDEWIRAYQFKDDPIAGKHYDQSWHGYGKGYNRTKKGEKFHNKYKDQFENIRQYLGKGMATGGAAAGPVGVVDKQGADGSGVADDVPAESDGFVINAAAVRHAGLRDINDMIQNAAKYAKEQGLKLDFSKIPVDAEKILVSNGEVVIPDVLADIIGYDRLEKINKRGEKETEKVIQEEKQQQQQPPPPQKPTQPVMRAAEGGQVKDEEGQVEELLPAEISEEDYIFNNPETAEFLKEAEGTIAYQTKTGSYDPETKKFLTYLDSEGVRTIAYGTTENVQDNMKVSEKEADMSLDQRIDQEVSALMSDKIPRKFLDNPKTKTAIVSLQYNLGRSGWPKAKEALQKGDIDNFLFYAYDPSPEAANTYLLESEGLLNRRNKEMKLFKEGLQEMGLDN